MIGFNIYFCIKQGKSATFSAVQTGLAVRRLTSSLMYGSGMLNDVDQDEVHHRHILYILHNRQ